MKELVLIISFIITRHGYANPEVLKYNIETILKQYCLADASPNIL